MYVREKSPLYGKTHTEETKVLMSQSRLGTKNSMYGKSHTTKTKMLISLARKGKIHNSEWLTFISHLKS